MKVILKSGGDDDGRIKSSGKEKTPGILTGST